MLALIYGKFIQVWREKQSAMASNQLTAILLSNTSHAVRTPLSQIINTLELALSGDIDADNSVELLARRGCFSSKQSRLGPSLIESV